MSAEESKGIMAGSPGRALSPQDSFNFHCHSGLECFNKCCRDINIFLTPYDILRLKNNLGISSGEFLQKHTIFLTVPQTGYPLVILKMDEENDLKCPFVTQGGCGVYKARPWSCRMAPIDFLGENRFGVAFDSSFCHGLNEDRQWTVQGWMQDQELDLHTLAEEDFNKLPFHIKFNGQGDRDQIVSRLFKMACYDPDSFRQFLIAHASELPVPISPEIMEKLKNDELFLMQFSFRWLLENLTAEEKIQVLGGLCANLE